MTGVAIALITTFGVVITALLGYLGVVTTGTRRHAEAARAQVQNSHPTNLRDDLDDKFEGLAVLIKGAVADIGGIKEDIRIIHRTQTEDRTTAHNEIERLERTMPTSPAHKPRAKKKE